MVEVDFRKVLRIRFRSGQQKYFLLKAQRRKALLIILPPPRLMNCV